MGDLAATYSALGRHEDALAMEERVQELYRRVLPEDHPDIGEGSRFPPVAFHFPSFSRLLSLGLLQHQFQLREHRCSASCVGVCA